LDRAVEVFWRKGYQGASLSDLTAAMRINRPSLYSAFGDKEMLFHKALARYAEGPSSYLRLALQEPTRARGRRTHDARRRRGRHAQGHAARLHVGPRYPVLRRPRGSVGKADGRAADSG
jgi:AcrR family transcriptional regulator